MTASNSAQLTSFKDLFTASINSYTKHLKTVVTVSAVAAVAALAFWFSAPGLRPGVEEPSVTLMGFVWLLIYILASILVSIAIYYLVDDQQPDKSPAAVLKLSTSKLIPIIWVAFLVGLATLGGLILLIIPGIIFAIWFAFSEQVVLFENKHGVQALKQSREYVRNRWWAIFGRVILLALAVGLASIIVAALATALTNVIGPDAELLNDLVSVFILAPIATIFSYHLYRSVVDTYTAK